MSKVPSNVSSNTTAEPPARHGLLDDVQGLLVGTLFLALSISFFRDAGMLTGGTAGLAFLIHYAFELPFGPVFFAINLPFYVFALRALGREFTLKTFCTVLLLSVCTEWLPSLLSIARVDPVFAAVMGGLLAGTGLLMLIRHRSSLGGVGVLAIYLQQRKGWRAGWVQMAADCVIMALSLLAVDARLVGLSVLGAVAVNFVIAVNHRPGRYFGI
ncbi:YitT family protein [Azoarcus sp. L1K30]|uniref:YitT family protein n=1 Tax=Azoarcus sp. L1K30 TaxID=2820277 RepID=UPI001B845176|nr:YitT family protein [Azoarcus sp. L1K30]MBR0564822.1 YitT family protein [Azoarcus sp. L1K30]